MFGLPGLSVDSSSRVCASDVGVFGDVETAIDMADEVRPGDIGRRRGDRAVDRRRQAAAVAGERAAEIGHQRVTLPIRHREKFRRHHPERQAFRHDGAAGIGVIAGADLDRRLDQETAGVIADRAERIVIDLQPLARRLAHHGAGHRRRQRCLVGGLRRRDRQPQLPGGVELRRWRRRAAGTGRRFRLGLTRIKLRLLAGAIERVISGIGRAAGRWQAILRDLPDPRRRRPAIGIERLVIAGRCRWDRRRRRSCATANPAAIRSRLAPGETNRA